MYTIIMDEDVVEIKRIISRMQSEKWHYLKEDKKYLHSLMESMELQRLPVVLDQLNYKELKMAMGAGIHGDAWQFAKDKLKQFEVELNKFIQGQYTDNDISDKSQNLKEDKKNGSSRVQTSKS